ncbi:MAG: hypothetical protein QM371_03315, partial [Bacillota bacterium]|nr:hypothetical protein [Bacillota bacterium]
STTTQSLSFAPYTKHQLLLYHFEQRLQNTLPLTSNNCIISLFQTTPAVRVHFLLKPTRPTSTLHRLCNKNAAVTG